MPSFRYVLCVVVAVSLAFSQEILTDESILKLVKAGMSEEVIIGAINNQPGKYALNTDSLISLKQAGVSDKIIAAMVSRSSTASPLPEVRPTSVEPILLHDGTSVRLRLSRNLSSADAKTGDTVEFEVLEDVKEGDVLLIARDTTASGTVTALTSEKPELKSLIKATEV